MKIAFSFIGTNRYLDFFPTYYEGIEKYFIPEAEKTFLVFTDGEIDDPPDNVKVYHQEHLEWPYITLKRFEIINKARSVIEDCDWFVFLDADSRVVSEITEDDFLERCCGHSTNEVPLFGVHHPCQYLWMPPHDKIPGAWDQNPESEAFVDFDTVDLYRVEPDISRLKLYRDLENTGDFEWYTHKQIYYQGCFWGCKVPEVCAMIDELEARTNRDLEKGVIAKWHDESHINKFYLENWGMVHTFGPDFAFPEVFKEQCNKNYYFRSHAPKIVHLAKDNSAYQI